MSKSLSVLSALALLCVGMKLGEAQDRSSETAPPVVYASGGQVSVYYPAERKIFVYTELGGHCVHAYTLTTPGGALLRENCR